MAQETPRDVVTLERGDIYMAYRPKVETHEPEGMNDIQRFYLILGKRDEDLYRLLVVGRKKLPAPERPGQEREWAYVDTVSRNPKDIANRLVEETYETKTRGERTQPAARPAGEGVYRIVRHGDHTHLIYALELPEEPGEVQDELRIEKQGSYIVTVKNPAKPGPRRAGRGRERKAAYPKPLMERFRDRRFSELDPPEFLDYEGAEIVLVSAAEDVEEELGIELETDEESYSSADIFTDLRMDKRAHPTAPLFEGTWE